MIYPKYTTTLKTLIDSGFDIGLNNYPIWNESHRNVLNQKIIERYYLREIGAETPMMFKFYLNRTMNEIMPYFNKLYETTILEYNPIGNADYIEEHTIERSNEQEINSTSENTGSASTSGSNSVEYTGTTNSEHSSTSSANGKNVDSDTPQANLSVGDIDSVSYASNIKFNSDSGEQSGSGTDTQDTTTTSIDNTTTNSNTNESKEQSVIGSDTEKFTKHLKGNYGVLSTQSLIRQERELIINIDMEIVEKLEDCFMKVW